MCESHKDAVIDTTIHAFEVLKFKKRISPDVLTEQCAIIIAL